MGEEPRPGQTVRLKLKLCSPIPPVRAAYDQSQHDDFHRKHREHVARFTEQGERISDDDARALVHLWLDLDLSEDPEWARDYYVGMLASSLGPLDGTPREEVVDLFAERSRTPHYIGTYWIGCSRKKEASIRLGNRCKDGWPSGYSVPEPAKAAGALSPRWPSAMPCSGGRSTC